MTRSSNKHSRARRWSPLSLLCAPVSLLIALNPQAATASMGTPSTGAFVPLVGVPNQVDGLSVEELDDGTTVLRLKGTSKPTFNVYRLEGPDRLVVDIAKSAKGSVVPHVPLDTWACGRVTVSGVSERGANLVRVVVELKREASYIVVPDGDSLVVTVTPREAPPEQYFARKSAAKRKAELQSQTLRAQKLEADASRLKQQASKEAQDAKAKAEAAARKVRAAEAQARKARDAEKRARDAEAAAKKELHGAKSGRMKVRRAMKKAIAEREQAEAARAAADAKLASAESLAKAKRAEADRLLSSAGAVARKRLADAAASKREAERELAHARGSKAQAERELADARGSSAAAKAELAAARAEAAKTKAASAKRLAQAEQEAKAAKLAAERAKKAAKDADAAAKKKLDAAEAKARARLAAAKAEVAAAKKDVSATEEKAKARLAAAEAQAEKRLAEADRQAKAQAEKRLAEADRKAKATEARAQARAAAILASARDRAAKESAQELASAKKAADALVAQAKRDATALKKKRLAEAEADANAKIARAEKIARDAAQKRLDAAEAEAERKLSAARKKAERDAIAKAEAELARVRKLGESQVASAAKQARSKARSTAEKELLAERKRIEADAKRRVEAAEAKAAKAEAEAKSKLDRADAMLASASKTLAEAKADRAEAQRLQKAAEAKFAKADAARKRAATEKSSAEAERKAAEKALATARAEAESKRGLARRRADARLAKAEQARQAAVERQRAASTKLSSIEARADEARAARDAARKDKAAAEAELLALSQERDSLKSQLAERDAALAEMKRKMSAAPKVASAPAKAAKASKRKAKARGPAKVRDVRFETDGSESRVIVEYDGVAKYDGMALTPTVQLLRFSDAKLSKKLERSLNASGKGGSVKVVTSFAEGDDAKVIVSTQAPVKPRLEEQPGVLVWHFPHAKPTPAARPVESTRVASAKPRRNPQPKAVSMDAPKVGGFASGRAPAANMQVPSAVQPDVTQGRRSSRSRWRGERIDIELQDAPIKDVLLLFSDIGRVNIVAGDGVEGSVTMKLNSVPWDQALDIILRSLKLGSTREGNVIRVATLATLQEEQRQAIERANARVQLKPLETRLVPLSYATVDEMIPKVQSVLSPRGTVTPDTRTNTLIVMDVASNIALAQELVKSLDTQTPQVLIEARIVEARTSFSRQLGIQWGFDFTASPGTGNPTGLLFPNSIGVGGGGTGTPVDSRGLVLPGAAANPNYAVDLPAPVGTGAGGAVGMSFGSISGNLNTNLRLSAAESTGEVRIISAPKVVTLDNSEATIEDGVQIPISQVSAQGVNTRFVNATLSLQVTPHVTNDGAVLLDVTIQKNEADFVNTGARGDPTILTKNANSRMLVNDADTAVIGGIYTRNKAVNYTKIPWLADVPIVGWFFKNKAEADTRSEVLIFLTPKIVNRASSIGG
ncbi:MAG: type IV pilus secretin PilQ [Nannocystaceae bacterium]